FQFAGSGLQRCIGCGKRYGHSRNEVLLELTRFESVLAEFDSVVSGIDGRDGKRAIRLNRTDGGLIDQNRGSGSAPLDGQRCQMRLWLKVENKLGLFVFSNADRLLRSILKTVLRNLYNVVLRFKIRQAQLTSSGELPLNLSVEKNSCVILT